jgi:hypothetical protein
MISRFESEQGIGLPVISLRWCTRHGDQRLSGFLEKQRRIDELEEENRPILCSWTRIAPGVCFL